MSARGWLRSVVPLAVAAAAVTGAGAVALGVGGDDAEPRRSTVPPATTEVTRTTLVETEDIDGTLGYGDPQTLGGGVAGTLTWLPAEGATVARGKPLYEVDEDPVVLMYGARPGYRALTVGDEGADVRQLEKNLSALGYSGFTVDDQFTDATAEAVRAWQEDAGLDETGAVDPGRVVFLPGAIRVAEHKAALGARAGGGPVFTYTGTTRHVTVDLDVDKQGLAGKDATVTVELPGGGTVEGTVTEIGTVAHAEQGEESDSGDATIEVVVAVEDQKALGTLTEAPVTVRFVADEREDVLTVPVGALLALAEGGYGVEVVEGSTTRVVPVEIGLFAEGMVEVSGNGLSEGMRVGVPAP